MESGWAKAGALVAAALLGGAVAVGIGQTVNGGSTTTVIREVQGETPEPAAFPSSGGKKISDIYEAAKHGVVQVTSTSVVSNDFFGAQEQQAQGSGFVIDKDGHVVTNYHVVEGAKKVQVSFSDEEKKDATVVGTDPSTDIAVLKIQGAWSRSFTPLTLGSSSAVQVGDAVVAIGNPFGLERTVTAGIVSALQRRIQAPNGFQIDQAIQTDAAINHGNSGGPLLDGRGRVLGINAQIQTSTGDGSGVGFAVPADTVRRSLTQLRRDGRARYAYLGVASVAVYPQLASRFDLPVRSGAWIQDVTADGPAQRAHLKSGGETERFQARAFRTGGDVVTAVQGRPVHAESDLAKALLDYEPGDTVTLEVRRGGERKQVRVKLGERPLDTPRRG